MASAAVETPLYVWPPLFDEFTYQTKQDYQKKYRAEFTPGNKPFEYPNFVLLRILLVLNTKISDDTFRHYLMYVAREMNKPDIFVGDGSDTRIFPIHDDDPEHKTIIIPRLKHFCSVLRYEIKQLIIQSSINMDKQSNLKQNIQSFFSLIANKYRYIYDDEHDDHDELFKESLEQLRNIVENPKVPVIVAPFSIKKVEIVPVRVGIKYNAHQLSPCRYGIDCRLIHDGYHTQHFSHVVPAEVITQRPEEVDGGGRKRRTKTNKRNRHSVSFKSKRTRTRTRTRTRSNRYRRN